MKKYSEFQQQVRKLLDKKLTPKVFAFLMVAMVIINIFVMISSGALEVTP